ncbi:MAG: PTS system mannose/fructose/sorbose family transporter subunit IID [Tissierellia bacterium]|nr:PTS system mannose/fructose/sorbose family transporter subunit IID [Tissierellia bacterium]
MTVLSFILISLLYFWCSSTALSFGIGYYTLYRPIISGMLAGLILKDIILGMLAGSIVNILYINFVSTGGSFKGDQCLTAIIAAMATILFKLNPIEGAAFAYPFGYVGIFIWKYRLNINSIFVKKYNERYKNNLNPSISVYNGLLPQILLYFMSTLVIIVSLGIMLLLKDLMLMYHEILKNCLFLVGVCLINISIISVLYNFKNLKIIILFFAILFITLLTDISSYLVMIILFLIISYLSFNDFCYIEKHKKKDFIILNKRDLVYSWFIWMNFSHSCYNYERLQGFAFAHSMKNIINKLYKDNETRKRNINKYTEFFNTEPNIGTPIHGFIISLEEERYIGKDTVDISYIKKGMMGIAAGLGDSFTQVVLAPLFMSIALIFCIDRKFIGIIFPVSLLIAAILYISYSGWMSGYYNGREAMIKRINKIKNNKIKKYFPLIFSGILGVLIGKLIIQNYFLLKQDLINVGIVTIIAFLYTFIRLKSNVKS